MLDHVPDTLDFLDADRVAATHADICARVLKAARSGQIAIVGSAALPQKCAAAIQAAGGACPCFVEYDPRFWGRQAMGLPILDPAAAAARLSPDALFICGVWSPNHRFADTRDWLAAYGIRNVLPVAAIFWAMPDIIGPHYQLAPPTHLARGADQIRAVLASLDDAESRAQLRAHLRWRVTLDPAHIPPGDRARVYFDPRLFTLPEHAAIADVGAFDGDSLRRFLYWRGTAFGAYHAFEPDPVSFGRLAQYCAALPASVAARITARNAGIGDAAATLRFSATGMPGSHATDTAGVDVACHRLDTCFTDQRLDYVKFDIEGAEAAALEGAWSIIARDRPVVAVAIYHKPEDIYALPLSIIARTPGYRYRIRSHDDDGIDLVFYAIPQERALP